MFVVAVALIAFGYAVVYHGASVSQAYRMVHKYDMSPDIKGGIPLSTLLGVPAKKMENVLPPMPTSTESHYPTGYRTPGNVTGQKEGPR